MIISRVCTRNVWGNLRTLHASHSNYLLKQLQTGVYPSADSNLLTIHTTEKSFILKYRFLPPSQLNTNGSNCKLCYFRTTARAQLRRILLLQTLLISCHFPVLSWESVPLFLSVPFKFFLGIFS